MSSLWIFVVSRVVTCYILGYLTNILTVCELYPTRQRYDAAYVYLSLVFDVFVFVSTCFYTFKASRLPGASHLLRSLCKDGVVYFIYISSTNLIWMFFIQYAPVRVAYPKFYTQADWESQNSLDWSSYRQRKHSAICTRILADFGLFPRPSFLWV